MGLRRGQSSRRTAVRSVALLIIVGTIPLYLLGLGLWITAPPRNRANDGPTFTPVDSIGGGDDSAPFATFTPMGGGGSGGFATFTPMGGGAGGFPTFTPLGQPGFATPTLGTGFGTFVLATPGTFSSPTPPPTRFVSPTPAPTLAATNTAVVPPTQPPAAPTDVIVPPTQPPLIPPTDTPAP